MARRTPRTLAGSKGRIRLISGTKPTTAPTTAADGEAIDADTPNPSRWLVKIRATVAATPSTITVPKIYIYDDNHWYLHKTLNSGSDIVVGAQGYSEIVPDISVGTRVDFAGTAIDENVDVVLVPLLEIEI